MAPLYYEGDYILCKKVKDRKKLKTGDIVIARTKSYGNIIKEISEIKEDGIRLKGTNIQSISTEEMGTIPFDRILFKVIFNFSKR